MRYPVIPGRSRAAGRLVLSLCLVVAAAVACSGNEDGSAAQPTKGHEAEPTGNSSPSLAPPRSRSPPPTVTSTTHEGFRLDVNRVTSDGEGFTVVHWTLTNVRDDAVGFREYFQDIEVRYGDMAYFQDQYPWYLTESLLAEVIVPSTRKLYPPVTDEHANCLCGSWPTMAGPEELPPGDSIRAYTAYYLPSDVQRIDFRVPGFERIEDIPLQ